MRYFHGFVTACILFIGSSQVAYGGLMASSDASFGVGSITVDTDSGLEWLDINLSTGFSYTAILPELSGGMFDGFRLATDEEVVELWVNAGIPVINNVGSPLNVSPVQALLNDFIGSTSVENGNPQAFGFTADIANGAVSRATLDFFFENGNPNYLASADIGTQGLGTSFPGFGAWLVRDRAAIPEPGSFYLVMLALGMLGWSQRRSL